MRRKGPSNSALKPAVGYFLLPLLLFGAPVEMASAQVTQSPVSGASAPAISPPAIALPSGTPTTPTVENPLNKKDVPVGTTTTGSGKETNATGTEPPAPPVTTATPAANGNGANLEPQIPVPTVPQEQALDAAPAPIELKASLIKTDNYPVDLATVLKLVEDQNLTVAQSEKNVEVVTSRLRQRQVSILPNISASYTQNWQKGQQRFISGAGGGFVATGGGGTGAVTGGAGTRTTPRSTSQPVQISISPQVNANWTIYPGGRTIYEILAARRRNRAAQSALNDTLQDQLARAAEEYYRLLAAYVQKGVIVRSIDEAREQLKLNQALVDVGRGVPLDLSRARTAYAQQQSQLVQAQNAIIQAEQSLLNRLNLDPTIHLVPEGADSQKKQLVPDVYSVDKLIAQAVENNPTVKTGEEELKALGFDYRAVRSDLIPSVTLQTAIRGTGSEIGDLQRSNSASISINMNLLENLGLQIPFRMQEQKKLIEQKLLNQKQVIRDIQSSVMTAFLASENYESALEAAEQELASAQESYDLAFGRFRAGYGIYVDVLNAEVALTTARSNIAQAILNYNQSQVQLLEAMGAASSLSLVSGISTQGSPSNGNNASP